MFENARLKLTAWYLFIIMLVSVSFSVIIYANVNREFVRIEKREQIRRALLENLGIHKFPGPGGPVDLETVQDSKHRFIVLLLIINSSIFVVSGGAGYFLAGRTLRPIKNMVDEQNRFIADASHELRTPLTSLRSEIEVNLRNKDLTLKDSKKLLESNLEEVVSLQTLSDNLLTLSQNGKAPAGLMTSISISECLDSALQKLEGNIKKKNIKIVKKVNKTVVQGIPDRITELFVILLDNAIKYSPRESTVVVAAKKTDGTVKVTLQDEGVGIHEEDKPHIFDRFYRASRSRSKGLAPGYGLGLSIVKKIVESHGGEISVESEIGKGTEFIVKLPSK